MSRTPVSLLAPLLFVGTAVAAPQSRMASATLATRAEGGVVRAAIEIEIEPGWHLYHHVLGPPDAVGQPTTVTLEGEGIEWSEVDFPKPLRLEQPGVGEGGRDTWIFGHEDVILLHAAGRLTGGELPETIRASLVGLTCEDEGRCIPYRETVETIGPGPDALFASFPEDLEAPSVRETSPAPSPTPSQGDFGPLRTDGAGGFGVPASAPPAEASLYVREVEGELRAVIEVEIAPGWHLYHDRKGPVDAVGLPTVVEIEGGNVEWSDVLFPEPERFEQEGVGEGGRDTWIWGHEGTIALLARGAPKPGSAPNPSAVRATVRGQTCEDDGQCIEFDATLAGAGRGSDALFAGFAAAFAARSDSGEDAGTSAGAVSSPAPASVSGEMETSLLAFLLLAVGWGLFALMMPCTYPMIPITISFFTKQAADKKSSALPLALTYGLGIVLIFVLIGVTVGPAIVRFATHPITNLVIAVLFLIFGLALFGVIDLRPPSFLMNAAGQASARGGYFGVFLMGATLVITSFTCTAPFVGSLLSFGAAGGDLSRVVLGMGVFGLTMAVPFVFLSLVPGKLQAIPRSGEWMHVLKVFLGFVEIAAALKFLSNSDLIWQWGVLSRELYLLLWFGIFLAAALFLFGLVRLQGEKQTEIGPVRLVGALTVFLFALYCGYGMLGHKMDRVMIAIVPPYSSRLVAGGAAVAAEPAGPVIVKDDYDEALSRARREGKLLLVNFTGHTCVNCRQMEEGLFRAPRVAAALSEFIEARLHTDGTANIERIRALQSELTGSVANPIYVIVDPKSERKLALFEGATQSEDKFLSFLRTMS